MPLDSHLERDTRPLLALAGARVLLASDSRWPWLILLPARDDVTELHHLDAGERSVFLDIVTKTSESMQRATGCQSVNVAMLGNVVAQLHCHVVARSPGDPAWPGPIWGVGQPEPRATAELPPFALTIARDLAERTGRRTDQAR